MTVDEYNTKSGEVLAALTAETVDSGKISTLLNDLREGFTEEASKRENAEKSVTDLTAKNQSLQESNMNLFLQIGKQNENKPEKAGENSGGKSENYANDFSEIFDEKTGELI